MTRSSQPTQAPPSQRKPLAVKGFLFEMIKVGNQRLRVGIRHSRKGGIPLLLFNGIGGNAELLQPFVDALPERTVIHNESSTRGRRASRREPRPDAAS